MKKPTGARPEESAQRLVDVVAIDQLAKVIAKYDLTEVEIDLGDLHVRLARERTPAIQSFATPVQAPVIAPLAPEATAQRRFLAVACRRRTGGGGQIPDGRDRLSPAEPGSQAVR